MPAAALPAAALRAALRATSPRSYPAAGRVTVTVPIRADGGRRAIGTVVLSRPTATLTTASSCCGLLIGVVSLASLLAAGASRRAWPAGSAGRSPRWPRRPAASVTATWRPGPRPGRPAGGAPAGGRVQHDGGPAQALIHGHQAMVADVSHQLRTPLAALRLRLDLLAQDCDEDTAAELAGAQEEIARLSRLVNGLLTVAGRRTARPPRPGSRWTR